MYELSLLTKDFDLSQYVPFSGGHTEHKGREKIMLVTLAPTIEPSVRLENIRTQQAMHAQLMHQADLHRLTEAERTKVQNTHQILMTQMLNSKHVDVMV